MKVKLVSTHGWVRRSKIVLKHLPATIGRSPDATVRLDDRWVSRLHCEIAAVADGTLLVRDLGSSNGTLVNGQHVTASPLLPGDKLTLGMTTYVASYSRRVPPQPAAATVPR